MEKAKVGILNQALAQIGANYIENLTIERTKEVRACNRAFDPAFKGLLRMAEWNFASKKVTLALICKNGEMFVYQKPKDCVAARRILAPGLSIRESMLFTLKGDEIWCNFDKASLEYTSTDFNLSEMDPLFEEALVYRLADAMCTELTGDINKSKYFLERFQLALENARLHDSREGYEPPMESSPYDEARG